MSRDRWTRVAMALAGMALASTQGMAQERERQSGAEPPSVRVGDGTVTGSRLAPYTSHFRLTRTTPDGVTEDGGEWTDWVRIVRRGDRRILEREVARYTADGPMDLWRLHENDLETLAPIFTIQRSGQNLAQAVKMDFAGRSIRYTTQQSIGGRPQSADLVMDVPVFDLSLWAVLLRGFPLADGYVARFPVLGPTGATAWETVNVDGRETVTLADGREVSTLVVSTTVRPWTVWMMDEAPYIAKVIQRFPDGSEMLSELLR